MTPKNAIVVGMPRSGTSMSAAIFANQGYLVAEESEKELRAPDEYNPNGYWEAETLIRKNVEVFKQCGFNGDNTWNFEPISKDAAQKINTLAPIKSHSEFVESYNQKSPWVWKDPRLCYTVGYWWQLINPETTAVLLIKRDPKEIYNSFLRVKWRTLSKADKVDTYQRIADHIQFAEDTIKAKGITYLSVNYSDFTSDADAVAKKINGVFGLNLSSSDLHFDKNLNNNSIKGKLGIYTDILADKIPKPVRKFAKSLMPKKIYRMIFPLRD